jgi:WD40 repeat protein
VPLSLRLFLVNLALLFSLTAGQGQTASSTNVPPPPKSSPGIFGLGFSHDGRIIATGNFNGTVKLWDFASGRLLRTLDGHTDVVYKAVFSPDGKILASCSRDGKITLWEVATGTVLRTLIGHTRPVKAVAFTPDGHSLASVSNDGTVRLWDVGKGTQQRSFIHRQPGDVDNSVYSVLFIDRGKVVVAGNGDGTISYWRVDSGQEARILHGHTDAVLSLTLSRNNRTLASGSYDHTVKLWDVKTGNEIRTFTDKKMDSVIEQVRAISVSSDGKLLASSEVGYTQSGNDFHYVYRRIKLWDLKTGLEIRTISEPKFEISGIAFSHDNRLLAGAGPEGIIKLWNVKTGALDRSFPEPPEQKKN